MPDQFAQLINSYLASELDLPTTTQKISALIAESPFGTDADTGLKNLWSVFLSTATKYPLSSPEQSSLLALLHSLASKPSNSNNLPYFSESVLETWNKYIHHHRNEGSGSGTAPSSSPPFDASQWTNLNSFLARATKERVIAFEELAVEVTELALEERQGLNRLDALLGSAGVWMIVMGEEIWSWLSRKTQQKDGGGEEERRELLRKWQFWKTRFVFLSRREDLALSSREFASEAEAVMNRAA